MRKKGIYIIFEGIIGTGKSTQANLLYKHLQKVYPDRKIILTREPGGNTAAEAIRKIVQGSKFSSNISLICEAYLYAASRAETLRNVVKPILDNGGIVISDRSYITSLTNQAYGRDLGYKTVWDINKIAVGKIKPSLVLFLKLDIKKGIERAFDKNGDKFESLGLEFYKKVEKGYTNAKKLPEFLNKWVDIDAKGSPEEVHARIVNAFNKHFPYKK